MNCYVTIIFFKYGGKGREVLKRHPFQGTVVEIDFRVQASPEEDIQLALEKGKGDMGLNT
jgi:hypothetical protein